MVDRRGCKGVGLARQLADSDAKAKALGVAGEFVVDSSVALEAMAWNLGQFVAISLRDVEVVDDAEGARCADDRVLLASSLVLDLEAADDWSQDGDALFRA
jgi:hypothetical protein